MEKQQPIRIKIEIPLPDSIRKISQAYERAGKDIFLVGGAVRDFIRGISPSDWDLVTNALPDESIKILKGFHVSDEQGKKFGVIRVRTDEEPEDYEIATYRKDISGGRDTKGEDQKVEMGPEITIEDDCRRRDFTINALFYDIRSSEIVDYVGGISDIKDGIIRAVGDATIRIKEDRLRICRTFRFASRLGSIIDSDISRAIIKDNRLSGIGTGDDVSRERIWEEIKKSWKQSIDFRSYLKSFTDFQMWGEIFPGSSINTELVDSKDFIVVIASLFKNEESSLLLNKLVGDYKIESEIATKVTFLVSLIKFHSSDVLFFWKNKQRCHITDETILEWFKVLGLDGDIKFLKFLEYKPTISANEIMELGFKGAALGEEIRRLESEKFIMMWEG